MNPKPSRLSRTIWVNVLALAATLLSAALADEWVMSNPNVVLLLTAVLSAVNIVLRFLTDRPITLLTLLLVACLIGCSSAPPVAVAQTAVIAAPTNVSQGDLVILDASQSDGADFAWIVLPDKTHLPVEGGRKVVFASGTAGEYTFVLAVAKGDKVAMTTHKLTVGIMPVPPTPPGPSPIPLAGLRVLVIEEAGDREKLPEGQRAVLSSDLIREYLEAKCATGRKGQKEYRFFDDDVDATLEEQHWRDALAMPRTSLPWIIVSNGTNGYSGPLPETVEKTLALLRQYGG